MAPYDIGSKVFFVTGGAQGLGKIIIEAVLARGAKVFFIDIQNEKGHAALQEFSKRFGAKNVAFAHVDVTNKSEFEDAYRKASQLFGYVDVLLNNAGVIDENNTKRVLDVNFLAVVQGTETATAFMRKDKGGRGGRIINMSSIAGVDYYYQMPAYCATKHAVRVYATALSQNPANQAWGLEFASLHPDASTVGLFTNLHGKGIHQVEQVLGFYEQGGTHVRPEQIVQSFIDLVSLEQMNGATYLVCKDKKTFVKVEKQEMGDNFPITQ